MAEAPSKKLPRLRTSNFYDIESNLISQRVVEELSLLKGKFGKDISSDAKAKMWQKITSEVNALGVCHRNVVAVRTKFRNMTRDAKEKYVIERKEKGKTGGGPAPKPITLAEENIINAMKDTSSFRGIDGGLETSVLSECPSEEESHRMSPDHITPSQVHQTELTDAETVPPTYQTAENMTTAVEEIWIRHLDRIHSTSNTVPADTGTIPEPSLPRPAVCSISASVHAGPQLKNKASKIQTAAHKPTKITVEDVYELQCKLLELNLRKSEKQMEVFEKQLH